MNWFWHAIWICFVVIPVVILWVWCLADIFIRHDLTGLKKTTWVVLILLIPWFGALVYLIVRPQHATAPGHSTAKV